MVGLYRFSTKLGRWMPADYGVKIVLQMLGSVSVLEMFCLLAIC